VALGKITGTHLFDEYAPLTRPEDEDGFIGPLRVPHCDCISEVGNLDAVAGAAPAAAGALTPDGVFKVHRTIPSRSRPVLGR
jgi:hypothetical protein